MFAVTLIQVVKFTKPDAEESLKANCTHVKNDVWIFEGDDWCLSEDGVNFNVLDTGIVGSLGGLTEAELIQICKESFTFDHSAIE